MRQLKLLLLVVSSFYLWGCTPLADTYSARIEFADPSSGNGSNGSDGSDSSSDGDYSTFLWDFSTASGYTYNSLWVTFASGLAKLLTLDLTDDDNTSTGFAGGTVGSSPYETQWSSGDSALIQILPLLPDSGETGIITTPDVLLLHFDESSWSGTANVALDTAGNSNDGSIDSATNVFQVAGLMGSAAYFNGSGYMTLPNESNFDFTLGTAFSVSGWIKTTSGMSGGVVCKFVAGSTGWLVELVGGQIGLYLGSSGLNYAYKYSDTLIDGSGWHHFVATYSGVGDSSGISIYIDGVLDGATGNDNGTPAPLNDDPVVIGARSNGASNMTGALDEIALWNSELSAANVKTLYEAQAGAYSDAELPDSSSTTDWVSMSGNEVLFHFDDSSFVDGGTVTDSSGNSRNGTIVTGEVGIEKKRGGKLGYSMVFDASDDYVSIADNAGLDFDKTSPFSIAAWIKLSGTGGYIYQKLDAADNYKGYELTLVGYGGCAAGYAMFTIASVNGSDEVRVCGSTTLSDSRWHHVVTTYSGSGTASGQKIYVDGVLESMTTMTDPVGGISGSTTNNVSLDIGYKANLGSSISGTVDEFSVWSRELSATEVSTIYSRQARRYYLGQFTSRIIDAGDTVTWSEFSWTPVAPYGKPLPNSGASESAYSSGNTDATNEELLLHFDESSGALADSSGNGLNGTQNGGVTYRAPGIFNTSLKFDGTDDYVTLSSDPALEPSALSISLWVKRTGSCAGYTGGLCGIADSDHINPGNGWTFHASDSVLLFGGGTGGAWVNSNTSRPLPLEEWTHIAGTWDANNIFLYLNGRLEATVAAPGALVGSGNSIYIGRTAATQGLFRYFPGQIEEFTLWSRVLSPTEVLNLYHRGTLKLQNQIRTCNDSGCSGETFIGSDGTGVSVFDELTSLSLGLPTLTGLSLTDNQFIQYFTRFITYEGGKTVPKLSSLTLGPSYYYAQGAYVSNCNGPSFTKLNSFSATLGGSNAGTVGYQLSRDGGSTWYYYNSGWAVASTSSQTNTASELNSNISSFPTSVGTGTLCFRAYMNSASGGQAVEIDSVSVEYQ